MFLAWGKQIKDLLLYLCLFPEGRKPLKKQKLCKRERAATFTHSGLLDKLVHGTQCLYWFASLWVFSHVNDEDQLKTLKATILGLKNQKLWVQMLKGAFTDVYLSFPRKLLVVPKLIPN